MNMDSGNRSEIDRTIDPDEYEAINFGPWRRWHAVAPEAAQTMCGLGDLNNRAVGMWQRWVQQIDRCRKCERVIAALPQPPAEAERQTTVMTPRLGADGSGNTPRRTIRVPDPEWDAAKETADANGDNLSEVVRVSLKRYVARNAKRAVPSRNDHDLQP